MVNEDERFLCVCFVFHEWDSWNALDRIAARVSLTTAVWSALADAVPRSGGDVFHCGDRLGFVLRIDPLSAATALTARLIRQPPQGRGTLRMAAATTMAGEASASRALGDAARMLSAAPLSAAHVPLPLVVVLSGLLYHDIRARARIHGDANVFPSFRRLEPRDGASGSWVWPAHGLTDPPPARPAPRVTEPLLRWLARRADRRIERGDHRGAMDLLRRVLAIRPLPSALVKLGECQMELGDGGAAMETWRYVVRRWPLNAYPFFLIGRSERRADIARAYLSEGLRIARVHQAASCGTVALNHELLLQLAMIAYEQADKVTGDRWLNEAAAADPGSAKPLAALAREARRRGEDAVADRLRAAALARAAPAIGKHSPSVAPQNSPSAADTDAILESYLRSGLSPMARRQAMTTWAGALRL